MTVSNCRLKFAFVTFLFFEHELLPLNIDNNIENGSKIHLSPKDTIALKAYTRYLV